MGVIKLQCPNCGGICDVDENKEFYFCLHCGTKCLIQQDSITNITNNNHTNNITQNIVNNISQNITARLGKDAADLIGDGDVLVNLGDIPRAARKFDRAIEEDPANAVAWAYYGLTELYTHDGAPSTNIVYALPAFRRALKTVTAEETAEVKYLISYSIFVANSTALSAGAPKEWKELFKIVKGFNNSKFSRALVDAVYDFLALRGGLFGNRGVRTFIRLAKKNRHDPDCIAQIRYYQKNLALKTDPPYPAYSKKLEKKLRKF